MHSDRSNPPGDLYYVVYVSKPAKPMSEAQLLSILQVARRKNSARNITGMLLYRDNCFLQHLEGPKSELLPLVEVIQADPRHHDVRIIMQGELRSRVFADWAMAFRDLASAPEELPGYSQFLQSQHRKLDFIRFPHQVHRYMLAFRGSLLKQVARQP